MQRNPIFKCDLQKVTIQRANNAALISFCDELSKNNTLRELIISGDTSSINDDASLDVSSAISQVVSNNPDLRKLHLTNIKCNNTKLIFNSLKYVPNLEILELDIEPFSNDDLQYLYHLWHQNNFTIHHLQFGESMSKELKFPRTFDTLTLFIDGNLYLKSLCLILTGNTEFETQENIPDWAESFLELLADPKRCQLQEIILRNFKFNPFKRDLHIVQKNSNILHLMLGKYSPSRHLEPLFKQNRIKSHITYLNAAITICMACLPKNKTPTQHPWPILPSDLVIKILADFFKMMTTVSGINQFTWEKDCALIYENFQRRSKNEENWWHTLFDKKELKNKEIEAPKQQLTM